MPDLDFQVTGVEASAGGLTPLLQFKVVFNSSKPLNTVKSHGRELRTGHSVRIHPKNRADAIDMMLEGKTAMIEAIEEDAEGKIHLALVVEGDPGKDLGMARQPGHRFFYGLDEVEPVEDKRA